MNELTFNGKNFTEFGAYVASSNFLSGAEKDVSLVTVPGRSGELILDNKRFKNLPLKTRMYITRNVQQNMDAMRNFLASCKGYCKYSESLIPSQYRMASFHAMFDPDSYDMQGGTVVLEFDAMPQRWPKSGDTPVSADADDIIENPTLFETKPLIRCYGTGMVNINDQYITISSHPYEYIDIDCELMDAKYGLNNANQYVSFSTTDYITLKVGDNYITHNLTKVEITPRWYEI